MRVAGPARRPFLFAPRAPRSACMSDAAIPASTLILVRNRDAAPPKLLMVERSEKMAFAAGALGFPGGRIDEADLRLAQDLGLREGGAVGGVRETFAGRGGRV